MRNRNNLNTRTAKWAALLGIFGLILSFQATSAAAQDMSSVEPLIERDADSLRDRLEQPPQPDVDVADTAIILTNLALRRAPALCKAFDYNGRAVGRARVRIPPLGLRWLLASDIAQDKDFIGSAHCFVSGKVVASAIFLGPGLTDLPTHQTTIQGEFRVAIPVVAHY